MVTFLHTASACFKIALLQLSKVPLNCAPATSLQSFIKAPGKAVSASQLLHQSVPCATQVPCAAQIPVKLPGVVAQYLPAGSPRFC